MGIEKLGFLQYPVASLGFLVLAVIALLYWLWVAQFDVGQSGFIPYFDSIRIDDYILYCVYFLKNRHFITYM